MCEGCPDVSEEEEEEEEEESRRRVASVGGCRGREGGGRRRTRTCHPFFDVLQGKNAIVRYIDITAALLHVHESPAQRTKISSSPLSRSRSVLHNPRFTKSPGIDRLSSSPPPRLPVPPRVDHRSALSPAPRTYSQILEKRDMLLLAFGKASFSATDM